MSSIRRLGDRLAADRSLSLEDAKALVAEAQGPAAGSNTVATQDLRAVVTQYRDLFDPSALKLLEESLQGGPVVRPSVPGTSSSAVIALDTTGAARPVYLTESGVFTTSEDGSEPTDDVALGDAVFRAAERVDDASANVFTEANLSEATRSATFEKLEQTLARVAAGMPPPAGLDENQALQLRSSGATVLLNLLEATPEAGLQDQMLEAFGTLVRAETNVQLRENLIFHFSNTETARTGKGKAVCDELMSELAPLSPPYEKWFDGGNKTVNLSWTVGGGGEFFGGFTDILKRNGFKAEGAESPSGAVYTKTIDKPGVGETTFRINVKEGGTNILDKMDDPGVQIVGYDGHSNWGRNMGSSIKNGPDSADGADGKLLFYNLCVGKGVLDGVHDKYPNAQVVTTYAASNFYTDGNGKMTTGEGVQALLELVDSVAERAPWDQIHDRMNKAANIGRGRTWDNYITPVSTQVREKVLDRDHDGQADYLDKHFNYNTFQIAEDTARELTPIRQERSADVLDGTRVLVAGQMINTLSEFSSIMELINADSKVVTAGYYEPWVGDEEMVRFAKSEGLDGKPEYHFRVNADYAHMSEECLRAVAVYEFNRLVTGNGDLDLSPVDAKLNGLILMAQSLKVDDGFRDRQLWSALLTRYNLPAEIDLSMMNRLLDEEHHHYAGSPEMVDALRAKLSPETLAKLEEPTAGQPV